MKDDKVDKLVSAALLLKDAIDNDFDTEIYPSKEDDLIRSEDKNWYLEACLGYAHNETNLYRSGYLYSARTLAQFTALTARYVDQSVYPIIFLYRHHIELSLKSLIIRGCFACNSELTSSDEKALKSHNLEELWKAFKPYFIEIWSDTEYFGKNNFEELVDGIDSYINQLCTIDKDSFSFHYSRKKDRKTRTLKGVKHINIVGFVEKIERLVAVREGCEWHLDSLEEAADIKVDSNV